MDEQQLQEQIVQLVQAAMLGDLKATQTIQKIMQAAQQGDQQAIQLAQFIQLVALQLQGQQVLSAKFGAKLDYIKQLRGQCPKGYEMQYFKQGGQLCKKCIKKLQRMEDGGEVPSNPVDAFKCGRKMKKAACGTKVEKDKCGGKTKTKIRKNWDGGEFYGTTNPYGPKGYHPMKGKSVRGTYSTGTDQGRTVETIEWNDGSQSQRIPNGNGGYIYYGRQGEVADTSIPQEKQRADSMRVTDWRRATFGAPATLPLLKVK